MYNIQVFERVSEIHEIHCITIMMEIITYMDITSKFTYRTLQIHK